MMRMEKFARGPVARSPIACAVLFALAQAAEAATPADEVADAPEQASQEQATQESGDITLAAADSAASEGGIDIAMPGVVVSGRRERDVQKSTAEVISVLSTEDLERTGEGDIAGALGRVTGLSVVGGGFVYVRGLGDRYSLALLNGSPLPSPEPLRRAIPLDLFPTDIVASSLVQKTYSPNFPGEFGGGVINLTTLAVPVAPFLNVNLGTSGDTETTGHFGYDYYGSDSDWTGYDSGDRDTPPALQAFFGSGERVSSGNVDSGAIAQELAKKYLHPDQAQLIVVGEAKEIKPELEKFGKVFVYDTDLKPVQ